MKDTVDSWLLIETNQTIDIAQRICSYTGIDDYKYRFQCWSTTHIYCTYENEYAQYSRWVIDDQFPFRGLKSIYDLRFV